MSNYGQYVYAATDGTDGTEWQGVGYSRGRYGLGAVTQQSFRYHDQAIQLAQGIFNKTPSAGFVLVTFEALGRNPVVMPFAESGPANEAYNDVIDAPGKRVYAGIIDREGGTWNEWFGAVTQVYEAWFTKERLKQLAPWIIGGAVLIAGAIYYSRRKPRRAGRRATKARRRLLPSWRRRTITVWR